MSYVRKVQGFTPAPTRKPRKNWCGPWAAATLLRLDYDEAYEHCLKHSGKRAIMGMGIYSLARALADRLRLAGIRDGSDSPTRDRPTLTGWLKTRDRKSTYLVILTGHCVVIAGDKMMDNQTREWVSVRKAPHRRRRVIAVYLIGEK